MFLENDGITISLLNNRSLKRHNIDVKYYVQNMMSSDISHIMVFTETRMLPQTADNDTTQNLQTFDIIRQDHQKDRFMSLALCTKKHINVISLQC